MDSPHLLSLAGLCEAASGPDRELDEAIADALFEAAPFAQLKDAPIPTGCRMWHQDGHIQSALRYTSSLDAASTLAAGMPEYKIWAIWHEALREASKVEIDIVRDLPRLLTSSALQFLSESHSQTERGEA